MAKKIVKIFLVLGIILLASWIAISLYQKEIANDKNKQLSEEEYLSNQRKLYQKEEFSTLSKNFQDNYMGPPNLAHQRIDVDNVSGKIGQERREKEISKYQNQPSFAKDQVYNTYINNDRERNNKK